MAQGYCKWPVIVGIIIGSLILISVLWCCARCLCCGMECCCGCFSCCNRCCPSPRRKNEGYQQPPQPSSGQYQPAQPMMYGGAGAGYAYRGPQTATFDAPTGKGGKFNEDALPAMPSWDQANSRHVQDEDVEMEKLDQSAAQQEGLLSKQRDSGGRYYNNGVPQDTAGDLGAMQTGPYHEYGQQQQTGVHDGHNQPQQTGLYHDYNAHQQFVGSPTASTAPTSMHAPTYQTRPPSSVYGEQQYAPSIPPSYRTAAPSVVSPMQQQSTPYAGVGRKPVQGSWRDV